MIPVSSNTCLAVKKLFPEADQDRATELLEHDCGCNLPFCERCDPEGLERIRLAAIKLSQGDIIKLMEAIHLAQTDWRDLLMAAEFARSLNEHERWLNDTLAH